MFVQRKKKILAIGTPRHRPKAPMKIAPHFDKQPPILAFILASIRVLKRLTNVSVQQCKLIIIV